MRKILFAVIYLIFLAVLLEILARGYYASGRGMSFLSTAGDQVYMWYPELKGLKEYSYDEGGFNVLLLGGSALTEDWGEIPKYLREKSRSVLGKKANIVNLAAAHGSLDSFYKYKLADGKRFDCVIFYHGINEVRANNVPPRLWKEDYSHYSWYEEVNFYFRHPGLRRAAMLLPYFLKHLLVQLDREVIRRDRYVPTHSPRPEWKRYGKDIKTKDSFRNNLLRIAGIAESRQEPLLVMTFAYYLPDGDEYDEDSPYVRSAGLWGEPENVVLGIRAHNEVVRELALGGDFMFLDQQKIIDRDRKYFKDICHFSGEGSEIFASNIVDKVKNLIRLKKG
ncbi:MAG: hypothetical protein DRP85_01455 [Candidatus Makaraimicrobium thalassicum]|nr:MAG: hypothetical protein DRP85_01455 [Candidatus Omnitrophota bacterium]